MRKADFNLGGARNQGRVPSGQNKARVGLWAGKAQSSRTLRYAVAAFSLVWLVTAIRPYDRMDWLLENLLVFAFCGILLVTRRYYRFSNKSYILMLLLMAAHLYGAHYSYTTTPFDKILSAAFSSKRDNYDRLVHLCFGLFMTYPILELLNAVIRPGKFRSCLLSISLILAASAAYELVEMWVALLVSPELGTLFLGTQGDEWDTQRDMAMALYGSVGVILFYCLRIKVRNRK